LSIIGSNSINTSGDLYVIDINAITKKSNRRNKRMLDLAVGTGLLILYPVALFLVKRPLGLLRNIISVLLALNSWVGYTSLTETEVQRLPGIKNGILNPLDAFRNKNVPEETNARLNLLYARDYKLTNDLNIILRGFRELGR
jgi:lipopolysaccharide/colanic/teichoic acid biosynthesis glycosyltransferase